MADKKITELPAATALDTDDLVPVVEDGTTVKATVAQLLTGFGLGSVYQPLDSDLTAIAALSTTSFGRSLLASADAAALRTLADSPSNAEAVLDTLIDAKGDLIAGSAADTAAKVTVGTDGYVLTADSAQSAGLAWTARQMVLIASTTLGGDTASFDFTSIPATYKDLRVVFTGKGTNASLNTALKVRFNGDSSAIYDYDFHNINNTTVSGSASVAQTAINAAEWVAAASADANRLGNCVIDILDYARTTFFKTTLGRALTTQTTTAVGQGSETSMGCWRSTTAINQVTILPGAGNWLTGSTCQLYGIGI